MSTELTAEKNKCRKLKETMESKKLEQEVGLLASVYFLLYEKNFKSQSVLGFPCICVQCDKRIKTLLEGFKSR